MTSRTTSTPKAAPVGRTVRTSLAVLAFTCGTTAATYAQTVPAPQAPASATQASSSTTATNPYSVDPQYAASLDPITINAALPQTVAQGPAPAAPHPAFGHLPILDVVVDFTQPGVQYNESIYGHTYTNQYHTFDPLDVGGTVRIPITPNFYLAFDRLVGGTLDQATERVIPQATIHAFGVTEGTKGTPIWPAYSRDVVLQYRADELIGKYFALEEGFYFRHRLYANDGSGVSAVPYDCTAAGKYGAGCTVSSTEAHMAYLMATYNTPPIQPLLRSTFSFFIQGEGQNVDHHVGTRCNATQVANGYFGCTVVDNVGYIDENPSQSRVYETTQGVTWAIPLGSGASVSARERWGALNWYENQPFPFRWASALDLAVNKRFNSLFTLTLRHSDYHTVEMGTIGVNGLAPFSTYLSPNAIHVASWDVLGTFHIDTNSWFH
jgi:hypothetical protein